jgi:hypothetical protein
MSLTRQQLPLWLKITCTAYVCVLVPAYVNEYPLSNFLWFCNVALLMTVVALWLENRLMLSMALLAVAVPELGWNLDFFARVLFGVKRTDYTAYMFMDELPLYVRSLSLYHVWLPIVLLAVVWRLGYDRRAWRAQSALACLLILASYVNGDVERNVNFAFGFNGRQEWAPDWLYLPAELAVIAFVVYGPVHLLLIKVFSSRKAHTDQST